MSEPVCFPRVKNIGLRGIPVADTMVSYIDGVKGELMYRGFRIQDLARYSSYEEVTHLLLYGKLPARGELETLDRKLRSSRELPDAVVKSMACRPAAAAPMDVLQGAVAHLADHDPDLSSSTREAVREQSIRLTARLPSAVAAWERLRQGRPVVPPDPDLTHAGNFLYMLTGERPSAEMGHILDVCLILHADHTFNASTFAAREVASTRAHLYASVGAAVGALSGDLHGGANSQVMQMLREIGDPERVESYVRGKLDAGGVIMGMGHAVYKTLDPRAPILEEYSRLLAGGKGGSRFLEILERVRDFTQSELQRRKGQAIYPNVDFYSGSLYEQMGIADDLFTPVFALGRISGWCAHVIEEKFAEAQEKPALYRPEAEYIGDYCGPLGCTYVALGERSGG
ncbi:MAG: citrate (Si)-synthase [Deltaproteobacteria bacterium]|nr:citrate (Si)-synthase [Deltaproteobacteria bacterium]